MAVSSWPDNPRQRIAGDRIAGRPRVVQRSAVTLDLFFQTQFLLLQFTDIEIIRPRAALRDLDLSGERFVLSFELLKMGRHAHVFLLAG
jgi:hypothetical protein